MKKNKYTEREEILSGNKLIAKFMGWEHYEDGQTYMFPNLYPIYNIDDDRNTGWISEQISNAEFHTRWDWIMPVVEKIAKNYDVRITWIPSAMDVTYISRPNVSDGEISSMGGMTAIENTWQAVVRFIEWYNTKSPHRNLINIH